MSAVHGTVLALRLPPRLVFQDDLDAGRTVYALVGFALAQGVALPVWGAFSDRFGRDKVIHYSLLVTVVVAVIGYAPLIKIRLPQLFLFSVVGGVVVAGLVLAVSYAFSLIKEGRPLLLFGQIFCGFFVGVSTAAAIRWSTFSLSRQEILIVTPTMVLLVSAAAMLLVGYFLPEARATSVSYTGMNSMQAMWHGFGESNRAPFAWWWKSFLGLTGLSAGILLLAVPAVFGNTVADGKILPLLPILVCLVAAALASLVAGALLQRHAAYIRLVALGSSLCALIAALVPVALGQLGPAAACVCAGLAGAAGGSGVIAGISCFAVTARQRSAGAEMGAVLTIWLIALLAGILVALTTFGSNPKTPLWVSTASSLLALFAAFLATRRTN